MGWTWAEAVVVLAAVIGMAGTAVTAVLTHSLGERSARRERRAEVFAKALAAVEDYAEMPYRIRRRRGSDQARHELTDRISQVQSLIAFHQAWLHIEAPVVAVAYDALVQAARKQAGAQMNDAWNEPLLSVDRQMNLGSAYQRDTIDTARNSCVQVMREALGHRRSAWRLTANRRAAGSPALRLDSMLPAHSRRCRGRLGTA